MADRLSDRARMRLAAQQAENIQEPAPGQEAGLLEAMAVTGAPIGAIGGAIGKALNASPKVTAGLLGLMGLATPSQAGSKDDNLPPMVDLTGLMTQREKAAQRRDEAEAEMRRQERSGRGPKFDEAKQRFSQAGAELAALDRQVADGQRQNSPEYRMQLLDKRIAQENAQREKRANTPFKELYADYMPYVPMAAMLAGGAAGAAIKRPYAKAFNAEMEDLSKRWAASVKGKTADPVLASELGKQFSQRAAQGAGGNTAAVVTGAGIGEASQFAPLAIDYARAIPGSDLAKKVKDDITDPWGVGGRILLGGLLGGVPAKIGSASVNAAGQTYHPGYAAETASLLAKSKQPQLPPPPPVGGPGGPGGTPVPVPVPQGQGQQVVPPAPPPPPPPAPTPRNQAPQSPPYTPEHSAVSAQYIDELLASGQPLPGGREMAMALEQRYAGSQPQLSAPRQSDLTKRGNLTKTAIEAGADPNGVIGKPGFLAIPATAGGLLASYTGGAPPAEAAQKPDIATILKLVEAGRLPPSVLRELLSSEATAP